MSAGRTRPVRCGRLERIAYHEAGHAAMSVERGKAFRHVTIEPSKDGEYLGCVQSKKTPRGHSARIQYEWTEHRRQRWAEREIQILLAGDIAHRIHTGRRNWLGATDDRHQAIDISCVLHGMAGGEVVEAHLRWLTLRTWTVLNSNWWMVEAIAKALLERKRLSRSDVLEVLRNAGRKENRNV